MKLSPGAALNTSGVHVLFDANELSLLAAAADITPGYARAQLRVLQQRTDHAALTHAAAAFELVYADLADQAAVNNPTWRQAWTLVNQAQRMSLTRCDESRMLVMAQAIAYAMHNKQTDKAGEPYIDHVTTVAITVRALYPDDARVETVAWLHDVIEDTPMTLEELRAFGFGEDIIDAVDAITHQPNERRDAYYVRVAANPLAVIVKRADISHNARPDRLAMLDPKTRERLTVKYADAVAHLNALTT